MSRDPEQLTIPVNDSEQFTVPSHDSEQLTVPVEDSEQLTMPIDDPEQLTVPTDDPELLTIPVNDSEQFTVPRRDSEQLTVPVEDSEQLTMPIDDPEQLTVPTDDSEQLTIPVNDSEQFTIPSHDSEQLTVPTDVSQKIPITNNCAEQLTLINDSNLDSLPVSLMEYFSQHCMNITNEDVIEKAEQLFYQLNLTQEQCDAIKLTTRRQRESDTWYNLRQGRLTASSFHSVLNMKSKTDPTTFLQRVLMKEDLSHIPAINWGIKNEETARQEYTREMSQLHDDFKCTTAGLVVNPQ